MKLYTISTLSCQLLRLALIHIRLSVMVKTAKW